MRVPWRDRPWDQFICDDPLGNSSCTLLAAVGKSRDDSYEVANAGAGIDTLDQGRLRVSASADRSCRRWATPWSSSTHTATTALRELRTRPGRRGGNVIALDSGARLSNATLQQRLVPSTSAASAPRSPPPAAPAPHGPGAGGRTPGVRAPAARQTPAASATTNAAPPPRTQPQSAPGRPPSAG